MSASTGSIDKKTLFIHLPKLLVILACLSYEIYVFITYSSLYQKYTLFPVELILGGGLAVILFSLLLRLIKRYQISKQYNDHIQTKKLKYRILYYVVMGFVIFIPTLVFTFSLSLIAIIVSLPALILLLIEIIFLLLLRSPRLQDKWECRIEKRKGVWVGILVIILLSPVSLQLLAKYLPFNYSTAEVTIESHYDSSAFHNFPQEIQQQVLYNASSFSFNNSWFYNGSVDSYVSDLITEKQLTNKSIPNFMVVSIDHISYSSSIEVFQTNITLNSTILPYNDTQITSTEELSINWNVYDDYHSYWINPGLNFSLQVESSVFLAGPIFYCEFLVDYRSRGFFSTTCYLTERCLLDSSGQILFIMQEGSCFTLI